MANRSLATAANLLDEYRFVDGRTRGQLPRIPEDEEIVPVDSHRVRGVPKATPGCCFISDDKEKDIVVLTRSKAARSTFLLAI